MDIEIYAEGPVTQQIAKELKAELDNERSDNVTVSVYTPENLTGIETLVIAVTGNVIGHVLQKLIDRVMDKKKSKANDEVKITIKLLDENKQFGLSDDESALREYLKDKLS